MKSIQDAANGIQPKILLKYRKEIRESQARFWARFGVTQSRGSRFEKGTSEIPTPVAILLGLYFNGIVTDGDLKRAETQCRRTETRASNGKTAMSA